MRKYKYIDKNNIEQCPVVIVDKEHNQCFANPKEDKQAEYGYVYNYIDTPYPETEDDGCYYRNFEYEIDGDTIIKVWSEPILFESEGEE